MSPLSFNRRASYNADIDDKPNVEMIDSLDPEAASVLNEKIVSDGNVDYSGFAQKTDPREIKLVRKLDIYIMASSFLPCYLGISADFLDLPLVNVLAQLPRQKCYCPR